MLMSENAKSSICILGCITALGVIKCAWPAEQSIAEILAFYYLVGRIVVILTKLDLLSMTLISGSQR